MATVTEPIHSQFSVSEWETIIRHTAEANEERKREYIRWTAAGLVSIAALSGLLLSRIAETSFGSHQYLSLFLLFLASYLTIEMAWQLIAEKIVQAVNMFVGVPRPGNVWDLVNYPQLAAEMSLFSILWELGVNLAITGLVALAALAVSSPASGYLMWLAGLRSVSIAFLFSVLGIARTKANTSPRPDHSSQPTSRRGRIATFLATKVFVVVYYGIQLWLVFLAFLSIANLSLGAIQVIMLIVGITGIAKWIWRVTWTLVNHHARLMGVFQGLHDGILAGKYADPDSVMTDVQRILLGTPGGTDRTN